MTTALALRNVELDRYVAEIKQYPLLSRDEEQSLAHRYLKDGDLSAAHELVVSNLRFVVKVAHEYRGYGLKILDLIQEGNLGLMHAVKKFDPSRGYRLISYAVWWIRAQMQSFIPSILRLMSSSAGARRCITDSRPILSPNSSQVISRLLFQDFVELSALPPS